jgi:Fe-S oxidoreductase
MQRIQSKRYSYICPSISRYNFHVYSGGGKLNYATSLLEGRIDDISDEMLEVLYRCCACGACDVACKYNMDNEVLEPIYELRIRAVEEGRLVPELIPTIDSLKKEDNQMGRLKEERGNWAEGLDVKHLTKERAEVYFHAGCRYSFDEELWPTARAAVELLQKAGVEVGIMGKEETCCAGRAYEVGYEGELVKYANHTSEMLKTAGVKILVTPCADCYMTFKVLYHKIGKKLDVEVLHITEYLDDLVKEGKLILKKNVPIHVTYHDPCHLGRLGEAYYDMAPPWKGEEVKVYQQVVVYEPVVEFRRGTFGIYEPPRDILKAIPGIKLTEMERIREYAWCCGAGGGVIDSNPDFARWTANERIEEAKATGAEAIATACPWCKRNFLDAIEESGDKLEVYDLVELVQQAI